MDDSNEFDIYEDLDVFESGGKQQEKVIFSSYRMDYMQR